MRWRISVLLYGWLVVPTGWAAGEFSAEAFRTDVAPILQQHCVGCHSGEQAKGDVDLTSAAGVIDGRADGWLVVPSNPDESHLLEVVSGDKPLMPKGGDPLSTDQIALLRQWIIGGAPWPEDVVLRADPRDWWSLRPLERPALPTLSPEDQAWVRTPVDAFVLSRIRENGLTPSPEADRRTLIRRLSFDLTGLPPTPPEVQRFVNDSQTRAYENLVDRLLASPHYGERWARHWLDIVHYADTHGYDKDKVRAHAWPYRDYVIGALNEDKPYRRFVREQLAGDRLFPGTRDGIVALGFIAAGPFDFVGQIEVANETMEKQRVRNIDRDDMVSVAMNTFVSLTAQCARCHDHKFDPITQEDYYCLQAVFAAVDRADRPYDADAEITKQRQALTQQQSRLTAAKTALEQTIRDRGGEQLAVIEQRLADLRKQAATASRAEYGYHSAIVSDADNVKWVQIDLGRPVPIANIVYVGAYDDFAGIGAGFGFPVRYRLEVSDDPDFEQDVTIVADRTTADVPNPGIAPQTVIVNGTMARFVRFTATELAPRQNDYIFALAEILVLTPDGENAAAGASVTALDSIEAPVRWRRANLVDGFYRGADAPSALAEIARLDQQRDALLVQVIDEATRFRRGGIQRELKEVEAALAVLPPPQMVYAAATEFVSTGNFQPTHGRARPIFVLGRGNEQNPLFEVGPGTVACLPGLASRFEMSDGHDESQRRAALAEWIVDSRNPLTWRSIVNRVWYYHFGRGIVETPNDFGRMGASPTHPGLLDWLAVHFRDGGQSMKDLHRLILNSATYRQSSAHCQAHARTDAGNRFLWRMNRRRLEAEAVRDSMLAVSGKLRRDVGGPGFRSFGFEDDHSPRYLYLQHDPDDPASHRRSIYRVIVRSVPDPFLTTLDCADPSLIVARRNETLTAPQALALLNNKFVVRMAAHFADRVSAIDSDRSRQVAIGFRLALQREPFDDERTMLVRLADEHGLANVCRLIFNTNEFVYVD